MTPVTVETDGPGLSATKSIAGRQSQAGIGDRVNAPVTDADAEAQAQTNSFCARAIYYQNRNYYTGGTYYIAGQNIGYAKTTLLSTGCGTYNDLDVVLLKNNVLVQVLRTNWNATTTALQVNQLDPNLPTGSDYMISFRPVGTNIYSGSAPITIYGNDTSISNLVTYPNGVTFYDPSNVVFDQMNGIVYATWDTSIFAPGDMLDIYAYGDYYDEEFRDKYRNIGTRALLGSVPSSQGSISFPINKVNYNFGSGIPEGSRFRIRVQKASNSNIGGNSTNNRVYSNPLVPM